MGGYDVSLICSSVGNPFGTFPVLSASWILGEDISLSKLLAERNSMPVYGANGKLAHAPRLVCKVLSEFSAGRLKFREKSGGITDCDIAVPGMVAKLAGRNCVSAFTQHDAEISAGQE